MCPPPKKPILGRVGVATAVAAGGCTAWAAISREAAVRTLPATPAKPVSAPSVDSGGFPLVLAGLVAAAVFVVVAVLVARWLYVRRRYDAPAVVDRAPIRAEVIQPRQRELTAQRQPVPGAVTQGPPVRVRVNARMGK